MYREDYTKVVVAYIESVFNTATCFTEKDMDILYALLIQRGYADPQPEELLESKE